MTASDMIAKIKEAAKSYDFLLINDSTGRTELVQPLNAQAAAWITDWGGDARLHFGTAEAIAELHQAMREAGFRIAIEAH